MHSEAFEQAIAIQRLAADPAVSVVLRAGAGSGKTRVLVDRYVRLCLAGGAPRAILAVTFTRKAAVEIKQRLLRRARRYALATEAELAVQLADLLGRAPDAGEIRRAATLFERLLEDFAALPVGTIHSFCQTLLGRFACEAGLDPGFGIVEKVDELWAEALDRLEVESAGDPARTNDIAALGASPEAARRQLTGVLIDRGDLRRWIERVAPGGGGTGAPTPWSAPLPALLAELREVLFAGTPLQGDDEPATTALGPPLAAALRALAGAGLDSVVASQAGDTTAGFTRQVEGIRADAAGIAERLAADDAAVDEAATDEAAAAYAQTEAAARHLLLTTTGTLRKLNGKKGESLRAAREVAFATAAAPPLALLALGERVALYHRNRALLTVGLRALEIYDDLKRRERVLDFHDLEERAWRLMTDPAEALHVQYRLDDALEHLLLDEFQDTNHNQWELLRPFVDEFLAGPSPRGRTRTVFVVGDVKQSIYRFRGARPEILAGLDAALAGRDDTRHLTLPTNFRSLPAIVSGVGALFSAPPLSGLLPEGEAAAVVQAPARDEASGTLQRVGPFVDEEGENDAAAAEATATLIETIVTGAGVGVWDPEAGEPQPRPARYGDILVLCRTRTRIGTYERALRARGIPILPAGRGTLAVSREVQDVLALLRWLVFPDDEPSLATALRSPFFRIAETRLQELLARREPGRRDAAGRSRRPDSLWRILRGAREESDLADVVTRLESWRRGVDREPCHGLLRRIYRDTDALIAFATARGEQARFNLLRVLDLALGPDLGPHPTLRGLARVIERAARTAGEEEAVHPGEEGRGRVRIMTVHGAKGLEAPIVLLVDADHRLRSRLDRLQIDAGSGDGPVLQGLTVRTARILAGSDGDGDPAGPIGPIAAALREATRAEAAENANLLYVALTRARDRCWVLGGADPQPEQRDSFLRQLQDAAAAASAAGVSLEPELKAGEVPIRADRSGPVVSPREAGAVLGELRIWQPPVLTPRVVVQTPSDLEVAEPTSTAEPAPTPMRDEARKYGARVHALLQTAAETGHLPGDDDTAADPSRQGAREEAIAVLANPDLAWIFHPEREGGRGRCEVPVIHRVRSADGEHKEIRRLGIVDRIVVGEKVVDVIDYKTNRVDDEAAIDELCRRYRPQLDAYGAALAVLWPEREIRLWLLLTHPTGPGGSGIARRLA